MAATLRQTAAPHASVKSEIHMASSFLLLTSQSSLERAVNAEAGHPFRELCSRLGKITPFLRKILSALPRLQPSLDWTTSALLIMNRQPADF
jgi:hypothetical protein